MTAPPEASGGCYPDNPVLARAWRGDGVESVHRGAFCLVDTGGTVLESAGAVDHAFFARSSVKCLQVLPLLEIEVEETPGQSAVFVLKEND